MIKTTRFNSRAVFLLLIALNLVVFSRATFGTDSISEKLSSEKISSEKPAPLKPAVNKEVTKTEFRNSSGISFGQILQLLGALIMIVGLIMLSAWLARKFGHGMLSVNNSLKITAVLPLGNKEKIAVLEIEGVKLIVGVTAQSISTLHVLECPLLETPLLENPLLKSAAKTEFKQPKNVCADGAAPDSRTIDSRTIDSRTIDSRTITNGATQNQASKGDFAQKLQKILSNGPIEQ
jgi:flagellar protein FliO/FliZ